VETRARATCGSRINFPANDGICSSVESKPQRTFDSSIMAPKRKATEQQQNIEPRRTYPRMRAALSSPARPTPNTQTDDDAPTKVSSTRSTPSRSCSRSPLPRQQQPERFGSDSLPASVEVEEYQANETPGGCQTGTRHETPRRPEEGTPNETPAGHEQGTPNKTPRGPEEVTPNETPGGRAEGGPNQTPSDPEEGTLNSQPQPGGTRQTTSLCWKYFDKRELGLRTNRRGPTVIERAGKCRLCRQMGLR
jgi:hypothetical protein